jgi:hypothetical protein
MNSFDRFYRLRFNSADVRYDYPWMPDVPPYATPIFIHSNLYSCALDVANGSIVDVDRNVVLTMSMSLNEKRSFSKIVGRLFGVPFDIDAFRRDIDAMAIDILRTFIDLRGCRFEAVPHRRSQAFGPADILVTNEDGDQALLTFFKRGVWQSVRYLSPTLILDPFGAIDSATATSLIRFYPPYMEDAE